MPTPKLHINARQAAADIRGGMSDAELMAKYGLSATGLQKLFNKLLDAGAVKPDELERRPISPRADLAERRCPACGKPLSEEFGECPVCGIVLAKFNANQQAQRFVPVPLTPKTVQPEAPTLSAPAQKALMPEVSLVVGVLGCLFLLVGAFVPVLHVPHQGRLNFFQLGEAAPVAQALGYFLIAIALASGIMVALKQDRWLWVSGCGCLIVLGYTFIRFRQSIRRLGSQMGSLLEARSPVPTGHGPLAGPQDLAQQMLTFQMDVGWAVLFAAAVLLIAAACIGLVKGSSRGSFSR